jgi:hypothetical protein
MTCYRVPTIVLAAVAAYFGPACAPEVNTEKDEPLGVAEFDIQNGSLDFSSPSDEWMYFRTAAVQSPVGLCSGIVLDPHTVLTARHCMTVDGRPEGIIATATTLSVAVKG